MFKDKLNYKLLNLLIFCTIAYLAFITSKYWLGFILGLFKITVPFLLALAFAYVLDPFAKHLENKGVRRNLAIAIVVIVVLAIVGGVLAFTLPVLYEQLIAFAKSIIEFLTDVSNKFNLNLGGFDVKIADIFNNLIQNLGTTISNGTLSIVGTSLSIITNVFIMIVVGVYFMIDMPKIRNILKDIIKKVSKRFYKYSKTLDLAMSTYVNSIVKLMLVTFLEYTIIYRVINHPNWLLLGVLAGITVIIPYFGGIFTNIVAVITASVVSTPVLIATVIVIAIFSNVDGYIISPTIYGKSNNLNPVGIIFSVAVCGALFGIIGIVIAIPLYIFVQTTYKFYSNQIKDKLDDIIDN